MPAQSHIPLKPAYHQTSLDTSSSSVIPHLIRCLQALGATTLAEKVTRCCTHFRVLACAKGHVYRPIPAERCRLRRCRLRLCRNCARWRQQRAITRLWPAIRELSQRHPDDRWVFITLTAKASGEPLGRRVNRIKGWFRKFRRLSLWKTAIRGAVAGYEVTYRHGRGWHVHVHLLASRQVWVEQRALARAWERATDGHGTVVDIQDRDADVRASLCRTLTYPFKPTNLVAWGPPQVAEFLTLGRTKMAECYGALRGLATEPTEERGEADRSPDRHAPGRDLTTGAPCPSCGAPLVAEWYTAEEVRWGQRLARHRPQAPPHRPQAA
jgi:Replication protein